MRGYLISVVLKVEHESGVQFNDFTGENELSEVK